jgi:hypothetical protein
MTDYQASANLVILPSESHEDRMFVEQRKLRLFPQWHLVARGGKIRTAAGWLQPSRGGRRYAMRIELPDSYPYAIPTVLTSGWTPQAGTPHRYGETQLCLMRSSQWTSSFTIALLVVKTAIWLGKYEVWCATSRWPGNQQNHGLSGSGSSGGGFWSEVGTFLREIFE